MTRLAAHRGGARLWPENSLRAFRESLALGADLVELDVHLTADGALAVIHDATLRRTTDRLGRVRTRTAAELRRARLRGPDRRLTTEHVPMLEEALAIVAAAGADVLVEVKVPGRGLGVRYFPRSRIRPGARYKGIEERAIAALSSAPARWPPRCARRCSSPRCTSGSRAPGRPTPSRGRSATAPPTSGSSTRSSTRA